MKRRFSSHTTLIELTMALLFFMLASVTILGLFTKAYGFSQTARQNAKALRLAKDCAAMFAAGQQTDVSSDPVDENGAYRLIQDDELDVTGRVVTEQTAVGELQTMTIRVMSGEEVLLEMPVSRYYNKEVIPS